MKGFCDGLGSGPSSKAAVIRQGLDELATLCRLVNPSFRVRAPPLPPLTSPLPL
jgi:glycerol-3-phosphate dehydrogenase